MSCRKEDSNPSVYEVQTDNMLHLDLDQSKCIGTSGHHSQELCSYSSSVRSDPLQTDHTDTRSCKEDSRSSQKLSSDVTDESRPEKHKEDSGRTSPHSGCMYKKMYRDGSCACHTCSLAAPEPDVQSHVVRSVHVQAINNNPDEQFEPDPECGHFSSTCMHDDDFEEVLISEGCHQGKSNLFDGPSNKKHERRYAFPETSGRVNLEEPEPDHSLSNVEVHVLLKDVSTGKPWESLLDKTDECVRLIQNEANEDLNSCQQGDSDDVDESRTISVAKDSGTEITSINPDVESTDISFQGKLIRPDSVQLGVSSFLNVDEASTASQPSQIDFDAQSTCTTQESSSFMFFDELPHELFFKILSYFSISELCSTVAPVCKDWYAYCKSPVLWQHLDLSEYRDIGHNQLCTLLERAALLKSLSLRGREQLAVSELKKLIGCPLLTRLNLGFCDNVNRMVLDEIVRCCLHLEIINMEGCEQIDDDMAAQFPSLPRLKGLNLSHCTKMTDDGVMLISRGCLLLEELNVDGIPWITDRAVSVLASERSQTLKAIYLDGAELTDDSIGYLIDCPHLHTLNLSFCEQLTDKTLSMLQTLSHLRHLRLKRGLEFSEEALCRFFERGNVEDLTFLDLSECSELMDKGITCIASRCPRLRKLAVCWCWNVSDVGIEEIVLHCGQLRHLDIVGLDKVRGQCFSTIPETLPRLALLDLRQCNLINDKMLVDLVKVKPHLFIFNYYGEKVTLDMIL